jgi:hypothetical protein
MSLSSRFSHDVLNRLEDRVKSYNWKPEHRVGKHTREAVDVGGLPLRGTSRDLPVVLIEAELRREDPASNVLKVWSRARKGEYKNGFVLFQGFSRVYRSKKYPNRCAKGECAQEFGKMMDESTNHKFSYVPVRMSYLPRAGSNEGNGARRKAAIRFADRIVSLLRERGVPTLLGRRAD